MFDFDLQMRFWRSVTEATLESATASVAAACEFQTRLLAPAAPEKPAPVANALAPFTAALTPPSGAAFAWPFSWPVSWPVNPAAWPFAWAPGFGPAMCQPAAPATSPALWPLTSGLTAFGFGPFGFGPFSFGNRPLAAPTEDWFKLCMDFWMAPLAAFTASSPWKMWQTPLTAMLMQAGMPYSVAGPAARAGMASMDAADAARQQIAKAFSAYRTDGGHASAAAPWPLSLVTETHPATFLTPSPFPTRH